MGRYGGGQRGDGVRKTRSRVKDFTWREKYVRKSTPMSACMNISASASVQVWACSFVHLNNCLPESETEWHSCSKRTPTGSGICSRGRGKKLFAHCSQFLRRKKISLRNQVQFHHWSRSDVITSDVVISKSTPLRWATDDVTSSSYESRTFILFLGIYVCFYCPRLKRQKWCRLKPERRYHSSPLIILGSICSHRLKETYWMTAPTGNENSSELSINLKEA